MVIDLKRFFDVFSDIYEELHNYPAYIDGYDDAVDAFDSFLADHGDFVGKFAAFRGDFVSSDREAAAFMFALYELSGGADHA